MNDKEWKNVKEEMGLKNSEILNSILDVNLGV